MSESRYKTGGLEASFVVKRADGKPTRPEARYFVLDYSGADPNAVKALRIYAHLVMSEKPDFGGDLLNALDNPQDAPPQHETANGEVFNDGPVS